MQLPDNKSKVLLSIVTWNHAGSIQSTIDSIANQTYRDFHLVLFDNHSTDNTVEIVKSARERLSIELVESAENVGFCGGHNYVIKNYNYEYLFLVNPDIILYPDYLEKTLKAFQIDSRIGAVCGLLVQSFHTNPIIDSTGMQLSKSRRFTLRNHGLPLNSVDLTSGYVAGLDGALPAFKKEAVEDVLINGEFFNSLFFSHKEDWDVSWRLILFNWKVYFNKESIGVHPRVFKPNRLKERLQLGSKIKFDAFKNQFLLLLINEDKENFLKDAIVILPRMVAASFYCLLFERKSLKAYSFIIENRRRIISLRKEVQAKRKISHASFRKFITGYGEL